ncbi:MAG: hypothetical protein JWO12_735 [Frankiales bacterium]|jgi:hypothetical protein|nr:hypothetical protein [Frankiales bacterium]
MTTPQADKDRRRKRGPIVWLTSGLAVLLTAGTAYGVVQALDSTTDDRVAPSSVAPVYGSR